VLGVMLFKTRRRPQADTTARLRHRTAVQRSAASSSRLRHETEKTTTIVVAAAWQPLWPTASWQLCFGQSVQAVVEPRLGLVGLDRPAYSHARTRGSIECGDDEYDDSVIVHE
jgi:hypothetical protein